MARLVSLRVPTLLNEGPQPREEACYLTLPAATMTVADIIAAKVRAEMRKIRMGASAARTLAPLLCTPLSIAALPDEPAAITSAYAAFCAGWLTVLVDGSPARRLDQLVQLRGGSVVLFCPHQPARC